MDSIKRVLQALRLSFAFGQRKALAGSCVRGLTVSSRMYSLGPFPVRPNCVLLPKVTVLHKVDSSQLSLLLDPDMASSLLSSVPLVLKSQLPPGHCTRLCNSPKPTHLWIMPLEYSPALNYPILSMSPLSCRDLQWILVPLSSTLYLFSVKYEHYMLFQLKNSNHLLNREDEKEEVVKQSFIWYLAPR